MPSRRLQSIGVRRVLAGLKAVADAHALPSVGRFVAFGEDGDRNAVVLGVCPGHPGTEDYQAAFPPEPKQET